MKLLFFSLLCLQFAKIISFLQLKTNNNNNYNYATVKSSFSRNIYLQVVSSPQAYSTSIPTSDVIKTYHDEIVSLRGKPELVDRLENLARNHPGLELDINLYRLIYPFPLDDFQIEGLSGLINGKNMIVSTPTG